MTECVQLCPRAVPRWQSRRVRRAALQGRAKWHAAGRAAAAAGFHATLPYLHHQLGEIHITFPHWQRLVHEDQSANLQMNMVELPVPDS